MTDRAARWLALIVEDCEKARGLVQRGHAAFEEDPALPLAFEALANRIGDLAKRLVHLDPVQFSEPLWSIAAKNRDFIVHHYDIVDRDRLWLTVANDFPSVDELARQKLADSDSDA
ncbi:DUF86 domain-containing protein [Rathayibacter sp. VKM Ac-2857]|uniref:HepT-like ribonuclease domain-containing protein n=1 Tax=Rathayibacter sp. VKM Ac-2857 TaxID=2739020 RepID=UPI001563EF69|nr:HepT-like ribonuclease domain-containing protein [Rathayibacter sp. VKM Ac-2857]NQX16167.1 hypothetical protein [Rathayibacter sp. VKM Ac-2857]